VSKLRLSGIEKEYGSTVAVAGIDLEVRDGEFMTLLGPSGCGKTTTLGLIAGFFPPTRGEIYVKGQPVGGLPPFKRDVGVVFQDYALFPHMSVSENVAFGLRMRKVEGPEIEKRVNEALELVQLAGLEARRPLELSGGQRQRVALARALVIRPAVLLLDEPLSNLDLKLREEMRVEIAGLQRRLGITTVFVTHDQGEALVMSDRIAVMNAGRIEQVGAPAEIYERPATRFVAEFIGRMNLFSEGARLVAIRPERARLAKYRPADGFARAAKVRQVLYLGATLEYHLTLDGGERALVEAPNDGNAPAFAAGAAVWFTARAGDCLEMPAR
jgi:ABC-type Fe3+/spermidine/putrescine transport system ATPase subunit